MNWTAVWMATLLGAVGGALGTGVAHLLTRKLKSDRTREVVAVCGVVAGLLASQLAWSSRFQRPPSRIEQAMLPFLQQVNNHPSARERFAGLSSEESDRLGSGLAHAGLRLLSVPDLETWNELRLRLAELSPSVCAALWTGKLDQAQLLATLERLSDPELKAWARVSGTAMFRAAEANLAVPSPPNPPAFRRGLEAVVRSLPRTEGQRLLDDLRRGGGLDDPESCWALRTVLGQVKALEGEDRDSLLLGLASL